MKRALIYCRVSSKRQEQEGSGLDSQRILCEQFAESKNLMVEKVFQERGITGGNDFRLRPAMMALIQHLDDNSQHNYVIIFDDLKRFARETEFHILLKRELLLRGAELSCPNFLFQDTPESEFMETVFAAQGTLELKQNKRQVNDKMRARLSVGLWVFGLPIGYEYKRVKFKGALVVESKDAAIVKEALEGFAYGRFATQVDVLRFFKSHGIRRSKDAVKTMLTNILYAGYLEYKKWGIPLTKAMHPALITMKTFQAIQKRLKKPKLQSRKSDNDEFPLRRKLRCANCQKNMIGSYFRGKTKLHGHYTCQNSNCDAKPKYHRKALIEESFVSEILSDLGPSEESIECFNKVAKKVWKGQVRKEEFDVRDRDLKIKKIETQIQRIVDRIIQIHNPMILNKLEVKISDLEKELAILKERQEKVKMPNFDDLLEEFISFARTPSEYWRKCSIEAKNAMFNYIFADRLEYGPDQGYRTPKFTHTYNVFRGFRDNESRLVDGTPLKLEHLNQLLDGASAFLSNCEDSKN